jgi:hypothetical protein
MTVAARKNDPEHLAQIERIQTILAASDAPLAELEGGALDLQRIIAAFERELEEIGRDRVIETSAATPAAELARKLDALDQRALEVKRRVEICSIVLGALQARRDEAIAAAGEASRQAAYDAVLERQSGFLRRLAEFLGRFDPEANDLMREFAECESVIAGANRGLPPGMEPIPSIEEKRQGERQLPKTTTRQFLALAEDPNLPFGRTPMFPLGTVEARRRGDGKFDVLLAGNAMTGGSVLVCSLVRVTKDRTERPAPTRRESLHSQLTRIVSSLQELKRPPRPLKPYVEERTVWVSLDRLSEAERRNALDQLNAVAEPVPAQAAAE